MLNGPFETEGILSGWLNKMLPLKRLFSYLAIVTPMMMVLVLAVVAVPVIDSI